MGKEKQYHTREEVKDGLWWLCNCPEGGDPMIDRTHAGLRCHTLWLLRTVEGNLPRGSQGTVDYEMDNLGRHLILVRWDTGILVPAFPEEIELEGQDATPSY